MNSVGLMESGIKTFRPRFGQVLISDDDRRSTVGVFLANPSPLEEQNFGHLFMLSSFEREGQEQNRKLLAYLEQELRHAYYYAEDFSVERAFESTLQEMNRKLQTMEREMGSENISNLHLLAGVVHQGSIHFSSCGDLNAYLVQGNRIMNILEESGQGHEDAHPRMFGHIVSGDLHPKGTVLSCTPNFLDYFSLEKLKKTVENRSVAEGAEQLNTLLMESENGDAFGALLLQTEPHAERSSPPIGLHPEQPGALERLNEEIVHRAGLDSMNVLVHQERATSELLTPSLWPLFKKVVGRLGSSSSDIGRRLFGQSVSMRPRSIRTSPPEEARETPPPSRSQRETDGAPIARMTLTLLSGVFKALLMITQRVLAALAEGGRMALSLIRPRQHHLVRARFQQFPQSFGQRLLRILDRFAKLSRPRKILLLLAVLFLFLFAQSIINHGQKNEVAQNQASFTQRLDQVTKSLIEAEAAMNYGNQDGAQTYLQTALEGLTAIPANEKSVNEERRVLEERTAKLQAQIQKLTILDQPSVFRDLSSLGPDIRLQRISLLGSELYGFNESNGSAYALTETPSLAGEGGLGLAPIVQAASADQQKILLLRQDSTFAQFNDGKIEPLEIAFPDAEKQIAAFAFFAPGRLYSLDASNRQIYKHTSSEAGFSSGSAWLTDDSVKLDDARAIAVDGAVYVLKTNGNIIKLFGGKKEKFQLDKMDPTLEGATMLWTDAGSTSLYVGDPAHQRVVLFTKDGKLVAQVKSPAFSDLRDIAVQESENRLLVLSGNAIYNVDLQSIKNIGSVEAAPSENAPTP